MTQPVQVLLIEDSAADAMLLTYQLERHDEPIAVTRVDTAFALQAALESNAWDIVISDYRMPLLTGLAALDLVRRHSRDLPFILVSATLGEDVAVDAMRSGANDYVMKSRLARLLPAFQRELRAARTRRDSDVVLDAQRKEIERLAHYDATTGLANRVLLEERLATLAASAHDGEGRFAVVVVQLDQYETIAGVVGRKAGDDLVVQVSAALARIAGDPACVARIDADRLAIIVSPAGENSTTVHALLRGLKAIFEAPFALSGREFRLAPSVGVAICPDDGASAQMVLRNAEAAAAHARASDGTHVFYAEKLTAGVAEKLTMESRLRRAVERGEFVVHYQPKVSLRDGRIVGVEALIRWMSPELGLVYPARFIPVLEETGLIRDVGQWVLRQATADHQRWARRVANAPRVAVNVSVSQLHRADFVPMVRDAIAATAPVPAIDLEITESILMENVQESIAKLSEIRDLGVGISIDDFGTGHSSLAYLARLPVNAVKIDRLFVASMLENAGTLRLVSTMIELAHSLRLKVVAEGVESTEQAAALRTLHCDEIQGYLVGRPVPWEEMAALLDKNRIPESV
jgi:diguanylate cyclase (GGDEF)-like protein